MATMISHSIDERAVPVKMGAVYVAVLETEGFIVGGDNEPSGVYRREPNGTWKHLGWRNIRCSSVAVSPHDTTTLYLGGGNGVFRSRDGGAWWRQLNDWTITEVQDVSTDPFRRGCVLIATAYGPWRSFDDGESWTHCIEGISAPQSTFTQAAVFDHFAEGCVIVGTEGGLFRSENHGDRWHPVGPRVPIRDLKQSAASPAVWFAATDGFGVLRSTDGGAEWVRADGALSDATVWAVALDPFHPERAAAGGYGTGVYTSDDRGKTWRLHPASRPGEHLHALAFDPYESGRLWVGMVSHGVRHAAPADEAWTPGGLAGATVWDLVIVRGAA